MNTGNFIPKKNISQMKDVIIDDDGNIVKRGQHSGKIKAEDLPKELLPQAYLNAKKHAYEQKKFVDRKQLRPDVRGTDIWKSMDS